MQVVFRKIEPLAQTAYALSKQYGTMKALEMISRFEGRMRLPPPKRPRCCKGN
jgi:hypothetical protein